jgi:hypothetical protein
MCILINRKKICDIEHKTTKRNGAINKNLRFLIFLRKLYIPPLYKKLRCLSPCKAAERLALPAAGGTRLALETDKTQSYEKAQDNGANPAVRVHAVLGGFDQKTAW